MLPCSFDTLNGQLPCQAGGHRARCLVANTVGPDHEVRAVGTATSAAIGILSSRDMPALGYPGTWSAAAGNLSCVAS